MDLKPQQDVIDSNLDETRHFDPPEAFAKQAGIDSNKYAAMHREADSDPESFWAKQAQSIAWRDPWKRVLEWEPPYAKWFDGGMLNVTDSCVRRHAQATPDKAAIIWEAEDRRTRTITYTQLWEDVRKFGQVLRANKVKKGDRVTIYMPLCPEVTVAMLACAHIGAIHSVVFAGFSADSLRGRIEDCGSKLVITADGVSRKGSILDLKAVVDEALDGPTEVKTIVLQHANNPINMREGRDIWWCDALKNPNLENYSDVAKVVESEHPLFILYTSGTTGKPKGLVHTTGGYLTQTTASFKWVFDHKPNDIYWCSADAGWITGHSYLVYGPLSNGATIFMYEGAPTYPNPARFWEMIERHQVTVFYTAPTAIRTFMRLGDEHIQKHNLSSLRLLGTVGEPINPEAWMWYRDKVGYNNCPIVDTYWQTETGSIMLSPVPGAVTTTPGSATRPLFGISLAILTENGFSCEADQGGYLVIKKPWPSMARGIWGDNQRFFDTYWKKYPGYYFTGDSARKDRSGNYWLMGRVDDVVNISGHRLGTMEIESALVAHAKVAEAAVVSRPDALTGEAIVAFVTPIKGTNPTETLKKELTREVVKSIGKLARPKEIRFTDALPKTRSGKIMRRLLRELATSGEVKGDVTTLEDMRVVDRLAGESHV